MIPLGQEGGIHSNITSWILRALCKFSGGPSGAVEINNISNPRNCTQCLTCLLCGEHALCWWSFSYFIDSRQEAHILSEWAHWENGETGNSGTLSNTRISWGIGTGIIGETGEVVSYDLPILQCLCWLLPLQPNILCTECAISAVLWWSTWNCMQNRKQERSKQHFNGTHGQVFIPVNTVTSNMKIDGQKV